MPEERVSVAFFAAVEKALESCDPKTVPPGKYTVILEPAAMSLIGFMFSGLCGLKRP